METKWYNKIPLWGYILIAFGIVALTGLIEYSMGRTPICQCGIVRFWLSDINTAEGSQQIADWYTFSHIIHGFIFYWFFRTISRKRLPVGICLLLAVGVEAAWELVENSDFIINRYRATTISLEYYGDSILNSLSDILFCIIGFFFAAYMPTWLTITLIILMEVGVGYTIRDNLTLNVIMLVYPIEAIRHWQMGTG